MQNEVGLMEAPDTTQDTQSLATHRTRLAFLSAIPIAILGGLIGLGVAGGELIIPTMVFAFGADIKTAGTASLFISLPTVFVGLVRYAHRSAFNERRALAETVAPMSLGSVIGAIIGGLLVGIVPATVLKIGLGIILIISAGRIFWHTRTA